MAEIPPSDAVLLYINNYSFYSQKMRVVVANNQGVVRRLENCEDEHCLAKRRRSTMDFVDHDDYDMASGPIIELNECSEMDPKDRLLGILDRIEAHVEELRRESLRLEERKDALFTSLDTIRNSECISSLSEMDRDDIQRYIERVSSRCMTVEISVRTDRDKQQEDALYQVNRLIDNLVISFRADPTVGMTRCQSFLAACKDEPEVAIDKTFELALLGCALDDQKRIKKRLFGLLDYLGSNKVTLVSE